MSCDADPSQEDGQDPPICPETEFLQASVGLHDVALGLVPLALVGADERQEPEGGRRGSKVLRNGPRTLER